MKYIILFLFVSLTACSIGQKTSPSTNDFLGCWTDSREENVPGSSIKIYRHCDYKSFPVSRFRFRMNINENNKCSYLYLAPNDAHHMKEGTWTYDQQSRTLKIYNSENKKVRTFVIETMGKDVLKIKE